MKFAKKEKITAKGVICDALICMVAALVVSWALYYFSNYNSFVPGGMTGFASIFASLLKAGDVSNKMSIFMVVLNLPIFTVLALFVSRRTGIMLLVYMAFQAGFMTLFKTLGLPYYAALETDENFLQGNNLIFAAIGVGVLSGAGFATMLRRFGASGGTFAISAIIKHLRPEQNISYLAFIMDASVVIVSFFAFGMSVNALIATLLNIFISDFISDYFVQGGRNGYKFDIITENPDELANEIMAKLSRGVTSIKVTGMHTGNEKAMLVCIVKRREVGALLKILKAENATFAYSAKVSEVYGNFKDKPE